jgi:hypothetical protein
MGNDLHRAIWSGPFPARIANGPEIQPGQEALVTEGDLLSGHWTATSDIPDTSSRRPVIIPVSAPVVPSEPLTPTVTEN